MSELHISISAEPIFNFGAITVTNSMFTTWIVAALLIGFSIWASKKIKPTGKPTKLQAFLEMVIEGLYGLISSITGSEKARTFFPLIASFFLFIVLSNWSGLLPGVGTIGFNEVHNGTTSFVPYFRAPTADLNTTLALAIFSVISIQVLGFKFLGFDYSKKYLNFSDPIQFFVGILEIFSELSKIISFAFRLFGNIFAGEVLLGVIAFLMPVFAPLPFLGLEIFVGFVQALVFAMLTTVFINIATISHHESHD